MIFTLGATPTVPRPFSEAAMVPATWVPWKSSPTSCRVLSSLQKSQPWTSSTKPLPSSSMPFVSLPPPDSPGFVHCRAARSGWLKSTPSSTTATTVTAAPSPSAERLQAVDVDAGGPRDVLRADLERLAACCSAPTPSRSAARPWGRRRGRAGSSGDGFDVGSAPSWRRTAAALRPLATTQVGCGRSGSGAAGSRPWACAGTSACRPQSCPSGSG